MQCPLYSHDWDIIWFLLVLLALFLSLPLFWDWNLVIQMTETSSCFQLVAAYMMTVIPIVILVIPYCMACFCSLIIAFTFNLFKYIFSIQLCLKMKLCCHSKIKTTTLFGNPFYKLAALNKKLAYGSRFHVSYSLLLFRIQTYTSLFPDIKMFPFYMSLN